MSKRNCTKCLAGIDSTGDSVTLKYRKSDTFGTMLGGLCTILAIWLISGFVIAEIYSIVTDPDFTVEIGYQNVDIDVNEPAMNTTDYKSFPMVSLRNVF